MPPYSPLVISSSNDEEEPQLLSLVDNNSKPKSNSFVVDLERSFQIEQLIPVKFSTSSSSLSSSVLPNNLPKQKLPTIHERHVWLQQEELVSPPSVMLISSASSSLKRSRRVSFAPIVEESSCIIDYIHINDYTTEEIQSTWYNKEDYFQTRQEIREIIRWNNQSSKMRGLEYYTEVGMNTLQMIRYNAMYPVLAEQERQRFLQINDPITIAKFSIQMTYYSQIKAIEIAKQDEKEVQEYLSSSEETTSNSSRSNQIQTFFESIFHNLFEQKKDTTVAKKDDPFQKCQFLFNPSKFLPISSSTIISGLVQD